MKMWEDRKKERKKFMMCEVEKIRIKRRIKAKKV